LKNKYDDDDDDSTTKDNTVQNVGDLSGTPLTFTVLHNNAEK